MGIGRRCAFLTASSHRFDGRLDRKPTGMKEED